MEELRVIQNFKTMGIRIKKDDLIIKTTDHIKLVYLDEDSLKIETIDIKLENFCRKEIENLNVLINSNSTQED